MSSSGSKKNDQAAQSAATPYSTYTPFGNTIVNSGAHTVTFSPDLSTAQNEGLNRASEGINNLLDNLPTDFSVNAMYNNPFYQNTLDMQRAPLDYQKGVDQKALNNDLNAHNQMGSSYDALMQDQLNRRYDQMYTQAAGQARDDSANAYQLQLNNILSGMAGLRNEYNSAVSGYMAPMTAAQGYQTSLQPLQTSLVNYYKGKNDNQAALQGAMYGAMYGAMGRI